MMKTSLFFGNPYGLSSYYDYSYDEVYPIGMPDLSFDLTELTYEFGYGKLSAGMLDVAMGTKKFGVLGQFDGTDVSTYNYGAFDNWNYSNSTGDHHIAITFLPVTDEASTGEISYGKIAVRPVHNTLNLTSYVATAYSTSTDYYDAVKSCSLNEVGYPAEAVRNTATVLAAVAMWMSYN
jgi:hypothetical protein